MSEELKPCPQCGGQVRNTQKASRLCIECEMDLPYDHDRWWYVRELKKKEGQIKVLREALEKISFDWANPVKLPTHTEQRLLSKLEIELIANEALKEVEK